MVLALAGSYHHDLDDRNDHGYDPHDKHDDPTWDNPECVFL